MSSNNVIDLSVLNKQQFHIGDKILELDTADIKVVARFEKMYPVLVEEGNKIGQVNEILKDSNNADEIVDLFDSVDKAMRNAIDFIFDSNVCEVCIDHGSLFDPINGEFRFEHIINTLLPLYEKNLAEETKKIQKRIKAHTEKYIKK